MASMLACHVVNAGVIIDSARDLASDPSLLANTKAWYDFMSEKVYMHVPELCKRRGLYSRRLETPDVVKMLLHLFMNELYRLGWLYLLMHRFPNAEKERSLHLVDFARILFNNVLHHFLVGTCNHAIDISFITQVQALYMSYDYEKRSREYSASPTAQSEQFTKYFMLAYNPKLRCNKRRLGLAQDNSGVKKICLSLEDGIADPVHDHVDDNDNDRSSLAPNLKDKYEVRTLLEAR